MRIGMVTGEYPPMEGGVGAYTRELSRALSDLGHDVRVFSRVEATGRDADIPVAAVVGNKWGFDTLARVGAWAAEQALDVVDIQFQTAAYDMHPSIHMMPSALRRRGLCSVVTFHDLRVPYLFPKAGPLREWIVRQLAAGADGVIATDRMDEARLREAWGIKRVAWVPIGSNIRVQPPDDYDRAAWRAALGVKPGDLLLSYFGFWNASKGGLELIEAVGRLHEAGLRAHLVMIGGKHGASDPTNKSYAAQVTARITVLGLEGYVHHTGFVDDSAVSGYFLASDMSALPYRDGVSLRRGTLMAALAHGRPIVTTHPQTDAPELDGVVHTTAPEDPDALAEEIRRVWGDEPYRHALEKRAAEAAEEFTWERIAERTAAFLSEVAGNHHRDGNTIKNA